MIIFGGYDIIFTESMMGDWDLEQIQIRQLSAKRMYAYYLAKQKMDIGLFDL